MGGQGRSEHAQHVWGGLRLPSLCRSLARTGGRAWRGLCLAQASITRAHKPARAWVLLLTAVQPRLRALARALARACVRLRARA